MMNHKNKVILNLVDMQEQILMKIKIIILIKKIFKINIKIFCIQMINYNNNLKQKLNKYKIFLNNLVLMLQVQNNNNNNNNKNNKLIGIADGILLMIILIIIHKINNGILLHLKINNKINNKISIIIMLKMKQKKNLNIGKLFISKIIMKHPIIGVFIIMKM